MGMGQTTEGEGRAWEWDKLQKVREGHGNGICKLQEVREGHGNGPVCSLIIIIINSNNCLLIHLCTHMKKKL